MKPSRPYCFYLLTSAARTAGAALIWLMPLAMCAQVSFTASVSNRRIDRQTRLEVRYTLSGAEVRQMEPPEFSGWQVLSGPVLRSEAGPPPVTSFIYTLLPDTTGALLIPAGRIQTPTERLSSQPLVVTVVDRMPPATAADPADDRPSGGQAPAVGTYDGYVLREGEDPARKAASHLFIRVETNRNSLYEGESLVAAYKLYVGVNLEGRVSKAPSYTGFSSVEMKDSNNLDYDIVNLNGREYKVYLMKRVQLYAIEAGEQSLEPMELDATVRFRKLPSLNSLGSYDAYSPDNDVVTQLTIRSDRIPVKVKPLPPAPAGYGGAVGKFKINSALSADSVRLGEPFTVKVTLEGQGNWAMLPAPEPAWPRGFESFPPVVSETIDSQSAPLRGTRTYTYTLRNSESGDWVLPPVRYTYFDPAKGSYITDSSEPLTLKVSDIPYRSVTDVQPPFPDGMRSTDAFTNVIRIGAPLAALALLAWLWWQYALQKRRRRYRPEEDFEEDGEPAAMRYTQRREPPPVQPPPQPVPTHVTASVEPLAATASPGQRAAALRGLMLQTLQSHTGRTLSDPMAYRRAVPSAAPEPWWEAAETLWRYCLEQQYGPAPDAVAMDEAFKAWERLSMLLRQSPGRSPDA